MIALHPPGKPGGFRSLSIYNDKCIGQHSPDAFGVSRSKVHSDTFADAFIEGAKVCLYCRSLVITLYIKKSLFLDISDYKTEMVIYMSFIKAKDFRRVIISQKLLMGVRICLKSSRNSLMINRIIVANISKSLAFDTAINKLLF